MCWTLSFFFSMCFCSIRIHLLKGLPTQTHLNWGLISSKLHILALMGGEPCGFIEDLISLCLYSLSLISFNLYQLTFISHIFFSSKSLVSHPSCPCCMNLIFSQAQVSRATIVMGNMKGLTFNRCRVNKTPTTQWHNYWALHLSLFIQHPVKTSKCPSSVHKQDMNITKITKCYIINITRVSKKLSMTEFCSQTCLYSNIFKCIIFYTIHNL